MFALRSPGMLGVREEPAAAALAGMLTGDSVPSQGLGMGFFSTKGLSWNLCPPCSGSLASSSLSKCHSLLHHLQCAAVCQESQWPQQRVFRDHTEVPPAHFCHLWWGLTPTASLGNPRTHTQQVACIFCTAG